MQLTQALIKQLTLSLQLSEQSIVNTIELLEDGATVPFISRYRKEKTGNLDEVQVADIRKAWMALQELEKRKETILNAIEEQGKLSPSLKASIEQTFDKTELEDLYLPYKKKRKTRATVAKEKGLEPLAQTLFEQKEKSLESIASRYLNDDVKNIEEALEGARDIIAEWVNEDKKAREKVRFIFGKEAKIRSKVARGRDEEGKKYKDYFDYEEKLSNCPSHRLLAMRRGEEEGFLRVQISPEEEDVIYSLEDYFLSGSGPATEQVRLAVSDGYKRLMAPSIETEFRNKSKEKADTEAIKVFAENLKQLLLSPPLGQKRTLAIDPGFRTGCKVVCLDASGNLLYHTAIFPHPPQSEVDTAGRVVQNLIKEFGIEAISVGNGTAGRETLSFLRNLHLPPPIELFMVNENGASIYSASDIAREEFPEEDVTVRGAISIGRRLMDPLAELVKIDPKSIGVGQYQHDVNQVQLKDSLDSVVESCVNSVGVNLNTASKHLLAYISGLGPSLAENIVGYRTEVGSFSSRKELKKVKRMGSKAFEQCAGFLRIRNASNPLDNTAVHPESYHIVEKMAKDLSCSVEDLITDDKKRKSIVLQKYVNKEVGLPTLKDIIKELEKPGLDPRGEAQTFEFAQNLQTIEDVRPGSIVPGVITNITNFGAFVDIGIKEDGLIHISQLANRFIRNPAEVVSLNQKVNVKVLEVDLERGRIHLSLKEV